MSILGVILDCKMNGQCQENVSSPSNGHKNQFNPISIIILKLHQRKCNNSEKPEGREAKKLEKREAEKLERRRGERGGGWSVTMCGGWRRRGERGDGWSASRVARVVTG